jgi:hypothetical protein
MAVVLANLVDGANVRMIQRRGRAGLSSETLNRLLVLRRIVGKKFKCNEAAEQRVLGLIDDSHPAAAKPLDNPIMGDGLADHCERGALVARVS